MTRGAHSSGAGRRLRIKGLVAAKEALLRELEDLARNGTGEAGPLFRWRALEEFRLRLTETAGRVADLCASDGSEPADLAPPSRRAYQLLSYLATRNHLEAHLDTLRALHGSADHNDHIAIRLDHIGALYRIERGHLGTRLQASEGFSGAPQAVLQALVRLATPYARKRQPRQVVREYAEGVRYSSTLRKVERSGGAYRSRPAGRAYDLAELFESINRGYFAGSLTAPRLLWSERVPSVEFGHFEPATDTVRLSRRLDDPSVPRYVLEHVMHHELLHRVLGGEARGERRLYHSARFRKAERRFARYREAEAFLRELGRWVDR
jgi:hypothetical protein